jgi:hypothetical protein
MVDIIRLLTATDQKWGILVLQWDQGLPLVLNMWPPNLAVEVTTNQVQEVEETATIF